MINVSRSPSSTATRVLVQGNLSMSWRANLWLACSIAVICLGIAGFMAFFGYWMVIPFAGLEVLLVICCLYWTVRRLSRKELITVDEQAITLEWGYNQADHSVRLPRHWSRLVYDRPRTVFDVGLLGLQAHGRRYLIGSSLGRDEKQSLYRELRDILL